MQTDILTIILAFFEGFALIISPCILPILPLVLAGSLTGNQRRPIGITVGFVITFALFAVFSRQLVQYSGIDITNLRYIAYGILILLGLIMLSTYLTEAITEFLSKSLNRFSSWTMQKNAVKESGGFFGGLLLGGLLAIVWTPCAGPILAAVIVQTAIQQSSFTSFLTLLSFAAGTATPMLLIAIYSKYITKQLQFFKTHSHAFRKILGVIILGAVFFMIFQERFWINASPVQTEIKVATRLQNPLWRTYPAPEIGGISDWINSKPLQISELKGKVVLIDFWTFSCINCIRTLPYIKHDYEQYHDKGLVIIGVHTPEFDFEKKLENVQQAVKADGILYPVALDNQFVTWRRFNNHFWPAHFLINKQGQVVYQHFGEGDYDVLENNIRFLLGIDGFAKPMPSASDSDTFTQTPEIYLGSARRNMEFAPSLQGQWQTLPDKIIAQKPQAGLILHFKAREVYAVMGSSTQKPITVTVYLKGKKMKKKITVDKQSIYHLMSLPKAGAGDLYLTTEDEGLEVYTFTFG